MRTHFVLLIALTALIGATPAAGATRVLGPDDGVQATVTGGTLTITFAGDPAMWTPLVGRAVGATCRPAPHTAGLQLFDDPAEDAAGVVAGQEKVAADGTLRYTLNAKEAKTPFDTCSLSDSGKDGEYVELAEAAVTPEGVVWLDESRRAKALHTLLDRATGHSGYRPLAALGPGVVAIDGPEATPAAGQTGYWTDGRRAAVATLNAAGRRLVIEDLGQGMLRTNVLEQSDPYASLSSGMGALFATLDGVTGVGPKQRSPYRGKHPLVGRDGLRVGVAGGRVRIRFTGHSAATFRKLAGRRVAVLCVTRPAPSLFPPSPRSSRLRHARRRVPRTGDAIALTLRGRPGDLCAVLDGEIQVALVAVSGTGRRWLQDIEAIALLGDDITFKLAPAGASTYWPTATAVAHAGKGPVAAMSGPDGRVAVGRVGLWTDGGHRAAVATTSASGWRPTIVDEGDGMLRSNLLGRLDLWGSMLSSGND
jgi:hypothetical protein